MDKEQDKSDSYKRRSRFYYRGIYPGIWLVVIGTFFLLQSFGYLQGEVWGKLWPVFIIIPGLMMIFRPHRD